MEIASLPDWTTERLDCLGSLVTLSVHGNYARCAPNILRMELGSAFGVHPRETSTDATVLTVTAPIEYFSSPAIYRSLVDESVFFAETHAQPSADEDDSAILLLAEAVSTARDDAGLSVAEAASAAGTTVELWQRIEAGTANPNLGVLERVADALDVDCLDLLSFGFPE